MLPEGRGVVARGGGRHGEVGVLADDGFGLCGVVLGSEEVCLGFIGMHCGNRDRELFLVLSIGDEGLLMIFAVRVDVWFYWVCLRGTILLLMRELREACWLWLGRYSLIYVLDANTSAWVSKQFYNRELDTANKPRLFRTTNTT